MNNHRFLPTSALRGFASVLPLFLGVTACGDNPDDPGTGRPPLEIIRPEDAIAGQYLFFFDEALVEDQDVARVADELTREHGGSVAEIFEGSLRGFLGSGLDDAQALRISQDLRVASVGQDGYIQLTETQTDATWGLDRIDERARALNTRYEQTTTGKGVNVYVIDTGIRSTHTDFGGRVVSGFTAIKDGKGTEDCRGHGTHVAGTIGGSKWGVAKDTRLHAVRVLDCDGRGSISSVLQGINWVTTNHVKPAVANMSLGGGAYALMDDAVRKSIAAGVTYVLAAGNSNADACTFSPARTPEALTVGASDKRDQRASFSNWGSCVDLFAPGVQITSAWHTSDSQTNSINGTSMAAPHVAGVAALFLEKNPTAKQADVAKAILDGSTPDVVGDPKGSPRRLLYSLIVPPSVDPAQPSAFVDTRLWSTDYNDAQGWGSAPRFWQTIQSGDLNGDGYQDMCGRGTDGLYCTLSTGTAFADYKRWTSQFADSIGWGGDSYWRTVKLADLNADGKADVCGRSSNGLVCALSTGTAFDTPKLWTSDFSDSTFWASNPNYWQTLQYVDVNGDKRADVCGRGTDGVYCALSTGTGFGATTRWGTDYSDSGGWGLQASHWQTLRFPDLNGDGKADVCGRGGNGMMCGLSNGTSFGPITLWTQSFSNDTSWKDDPKYWQTLQYVDLNGDKWADLCGRGTDGVYCMLSTGTAFADYKRWTSQFADSIGWGAYAYHWQTVRFPDVNGDGKADVCGRAGNGVLCALSTGTAFDRVTEWTPRYNDSEGWTSGPQYYGTTQYLDLNKDGRSDICMRSKDGLVCSLAGMPPRPSSL
ncbi:S8 family serine peptidase [Archangium violaceum]|uniref:S8 family serine peptidase n=1 Tax=Archangium violaceum TaxID=83451 RepID=UPI002B2F90D0|nr:S8 family serine peptidase [Archangium violaceum]